MAAAANSADDAPAGLSGLPEAEREQALARWQVLRAHLEDGWPLVRVAAAHDIPERTLRRWLAAYRTGAGRAGAPAPVGPRNPADAARPAAADRVCGIPAAFHVDHGSDFTSAHLEQVMADLRIRAYFSLPGQPRRPDSD